MALSERERAIVARAETELPGLAKAVELCQTRPARRQRQALAAFASEFVARNHDRLSIFADMKVHVLHNVASLMGVEVIPAGKILYHEGERGQIMHMLVSGRLGVYVNNDAPTKPSDSADADAAASPAKSWTPCSESMECLRAANGALLGAKKMALAALGENVTPGLKIGRCNTHACAATPGLPSGPGVHLLAQSPMFRTFAARSAGRHARGIPGRDPESAVAAASGSGQGRAAARQSTAAEPLAGGRSRHAGRRDSALSRREASRASIGSHEAGRSRPAAGAPPTGRPPSSRLRPVIRLAPTLASSAALAEQILADPDPVAVPVAHGLGFESLSAPAGVHRVATIHAPKSFGEVALKTKSRRRTATIVADTDCVAFTITLADIEAHASVAGILATKTELFKLLAGLSWTRGTPSTQLTTLAYQLRPLSVKAGEVVVREGDVSPMLYVVVSGTFAVSASSTGAPVRRALQAGAGKGRSNLGEQQLKEKLLVVGELGVGECFGERSCVFGAPEEFRVSARSKASVLEIPRTDLQAILPVCGPALASILRARDTDRARRLELAARAQADDIVRAMGRDQVLDIDDAPSPSDRRSTVAPAKVTTYAPEEPAGPVSRLVRTRNPAALVSHLSMAKSAATQVFRAGRAVEFEADAAMPRGRVSGMARIESAAPSPAAVNLGPGSVVTGKASAAAHRRQDVTAQPPSLLTSSFRQRLAQPPVLAGADGEVLAGPARLAMGDSGIEVGRRSSALKHHESWAQSPTSSQLSKTPPGFRRSISSRTRPTRRASRALDARRGSIVSLLSGVVFLEDSDVAESSNGAPELSAPASTRRQLRRGASLRKALHGAAAAPTHGKCAAGGKANAAMTTSFATLSDELLEPQPSQPGHDSPSHARRRPSASVGTLGSGVSQTGRAPLPIAAQGNEEVSWRGAAAAKRPAAATSILSAHHAPPLKGVPDGEKPFAARAPAVRPALRTGGGSRRAVLEASRRAQASKEALRRLLHGEDDDESAREVKRHERLDRRPLRRMGVDVHRGTAGPRLPGRLIGPERRDQRRQ